MIQASTGFYNEPVLRRLQQMSDVPFAEELVHRKKPRELEYLDSRDVHMELSRLKLDPSQLRAVTRGLTHRVSVIQGPPGTLSSLKSIHSLFDRKRLYRPIRTATI